MRAVLARSRVAALAVSKKPSAVAPFGTSATTSPITNDKVPSLYSNSKIQSRDVPIQLRQSGDNGDGGLEGDGSRLLIDTRLRKGPFWHLSQEAGAWCYSVYNKIYHPRAYIKPEDGGLMKEYEYLTEHVTMWNVAVERQIQVKGPDAAKFTDYVITRSVEKCPTNKCRYVILTNQEGGILNDPILLRPHDDEFWFSLADSDVGMYLQGVNHDGRFDVTIKEIDVAPVQIQGPKSVALMSELTNGATDSMKYYDMIHSEVGGCPVVISASGFSAEMGFEIYLHDATVKAEQMWNAVLAAGEKHNLKVIAPGHHRRIEAGILSYNQDIDIETNPFQCGLGWQCDFSKDDWIGKKALQKIKADGVTHKLAGLRMEGDPITWYAADFYHVFDEVGDMVGYVTSAWFSPTQNSNIALAMLPVEYADIGTNLTVALPKMYSPGGVPVKAEVAKTPFKPPAAGHKGTGLLQTGSKL